MKSLFLTALFTMSIIYASWADNYHLNESKLDQAFESSVDVSNDLSVTSFFESSSVESNAMLADGGMDKHTLGAIICFAEWFLGVGILIPIHRLYLGCGDKTIKVVALYCVTLGGCGLLPIIDGIMLIMDQGGTKYIDNPKFLMWTK